MAIYLTTGTPGAGKTLWTLWTVEQRRIADNKEFHAKWIAAGSDTDNPPMVRDVYYFNINIKKLPWIRLAKPEDWLDAPVGSLFVFDECQEAFPPRANSSIPPKYVSELAKARHGGYDLYFVTQHPTFVDPYIRKLAEEHNHLMRPWGAKKAVVHTWKGVKDQCDKSRAGSLTTSFSHPKEVYSWYKSAEVHTHKFKLPTKVKLMLLVPFLIGFCLYGVYKHFDKKIEDAKSPVVPVNANRQPINQSGQAKIEFDPASFKTRFDDIPWSSPRYDHLTQATVAPRIVGCMIYQNKCKCMTQQGTYHITSMQFCQVVVENGIFQDFDDGGGQSIDRNKESQQVKTEQPKPTPAPASEKVAYVDSGFNLPIKKPVDQYAQQSTTAPSGNMYVKGLPDSKVLLGNR
jgi:zona occludens toxin